MSGQSEWRMDCGDAVDWLNAQPAASANLLLTDPAYESLEKHRARGTTTRLRTEWFPIFANSRFPDFMQAAFRVLAPDSHFYLICDAETMFVVKPMGEAAGFKFWKPIVWDKRNIGMGYHYRSRYEVILFFEKGKRKLNNLGIADVLECPRVTRGYPTEKPVPLLRTLICQSTRVGERVLDPFAGSGAVGEAALLESRLFAGCDLLTTAVEQATRRLETKKGEIHAKS